jgi:hypothetical protein
LRSRTGPRRQTAPQPWRIRSLAEPFLDTHVRLYFAEIIFAILGVAAKLKRRRIPERTARGRADAKVAVWIAPAPISNRLGD